MKTNEVANSLLVSTFSIKSYFLGLNYLDNCVLQMIPKEPYLTSHSFPHLKPMSPMAC